MPNKSAKSGDTDHVIRPRLCALLSRAVKSPLVLVLAGAGYGKSIAVSDFAKECSLPVVSLNFTEDDNDCGKFREKFPYSIDDLLRKKKHLVILDNAHCVKNPEIIEFFEQIIHDNSGKITLIMVCREVPLINVTDMMMRGFVYNINEDDLRFNKNELVRFFSTQ